jgi:hypothetical protein
MATPKKQGKKKSWAQKQLSTAESNARKRATPSAKKRAERGMSAPLTDFNSGRNKNRAASPLRRKKAQVLEKKKLDGMTGAAVTKGSETKRIVRKAVKNDPTVQAFKRATSSKKKTTSTKKKK